MNLPPHDLPPNQSSQDQPDLNPEWAEMAGAIAETEDFLAQVKQRFNEVRTAQSDRQQLQQQQLEIKQKLKSKAASTKSNLSQDQWRDRQSLKQQLVEVETKISEIAVDLESRLFSWQSFREPFWQILRFGGIGLILGWYLRGFSSQ